MMKCSLGFSWTVKATRRVQTMDLKNGKIDWNCNPETAWGGIHRDIVLLSKVPPIEGFTVGEIAPGGAVELDDDREERLTAGTRVTTAAPVSSPHCRWKRVQRGRKMITCFCFAENCADIMENNIMEIFEDSCNKPGGGNELASEKEARCPSGQYMDKECFEAAIKKTMWKTTNADGQTAGYTKSTLLPPGSITAAFEEIEEVSQTDTESIFGMAFVIKIAVGIIAIAAVFLGVAACIWIRRRKKEQVRSETSKREETPSRTGKQNNK